MEVDNDSSAKRDEGRKSANSEIEDHLKGKPFKIEARDIIMKPFILARDTYLQNLIHQDYIDAYQSTPNFIRRLTDISDEVMTYNTPQEKKLFLKQALCDVNTRLPAQVYIPFVNKSMRTHAVLHIAVDEAKIFQTKERAPLLLCIEAYRPIEMTLGDAPEIYETEAFQNLQADKNVVDMKKRKSTSKARITAMKDA